MSTMTIAVQRYGAPGEPVLVWEAVSTPLPDDVARKHRADLTRRRRSRNLNRLPDGIEFDTYPPGYHPPGYHPPGCPELAGSRTRVTFTTQP